jgi:hypothetical protein
VRQLGKYLRPGGLLKLMVYHRRSWRALELLLREGRGRFWDLDRIVARGSEAQTGCPVTYTYSRRGAAQLARCAGVDVTEVRVAHIFPYRIDDYVEHRHVRRWYFRALPDRAFGALERRYGWHLLVSGTRP